MKLRSTIFPLMLAGATIAVLALMNRLRNRLLQLWVILRR